MGALLTKTWLLWRNKAGLNFGKKMLYQANKLKGYFTKSKTLHIQVIVINITTVHGKCIVSLLGYMVYTAFVLFSFAKQRLSQVKVSEYWWLFCIILDSILLEDA